MTEVISIPTDQAGVVLRQLSTFEDAFAYSEAVRANPDHLSQHGDTTYEKYPDFDAVLESVLHPENPDKLRMGIWDGDQLVGSVNLTPGDGEAEIGYWLDSRHTGNGYATLATSAIAGYAAERFDRVFAEVEADNTPSARVLERAGFDQTAQLAGRLIFELASIEPYGTKNII